MDFGAPKSAAERGWHLPVPPRCPSGWQQALGNTVLVCSWGKGMLEEDADEVYIRPFFPFIFLSFLEIQCLFCLQFPAGKPPSLRQHAPAQTLGTGAGQVGGILGLGTRWSE